MGCHKQSDEATAYKVNISFLQPSSGQIVTVNSPFTVSIKITSENNAVIHHLQVDLTTEAGTFVKNVLPQTHLHTEGVATSIIQTTAPSIAGRYKIIAISTDDDEKQPNSNEVIFTVQ